MSGPIIRKYGFPNFEAIFGTREIQHGVPEEPTSQPVDHSKNESQSLSQGSPPAANATEAEKQSEDSAQL